MMINKLRKLLFGNAKKVKLQDVIIKLDMSKTYLFILNRYDWGGVDLSNILNIGKNSKIVIVDNNKVEPIYRILEISVDK